MTSQPLSRRKRLYPARNRRGRSAEGAGSVNVYTFSFVGFAWGLRLRCLAKPIPIRAVPEIDRLLLRLADKKLSRQMVERVLVMLHAMLEEAVENDVLAKNPTRKVEMPDCKPAEETRSLTVEEVNRLCSSMQGQDYLIFRMMVLCGPRPNEVFALTREDYLGTTLRFDESIGRGENRFSTTKNKKTRYAPVPGSLRMELEAWLEGRPPQPDALIFPAPRGGPISHEGYGRKIIVRARTAAKIEDLTSACCERALPRSTMAISRTPT